MWNSFFPVNILDIFLEITEFSLKKYLHKEIILKNIEVQHLDVLRKNFL